MMKPRISLFAEHEREVRRTTIGDPLVGLTKHVDFGARAASIYHAAPRPSRAKGGRPPYPTVLIVDASLVQAPVQRNKREEAEIVKDGTKA